MSAPDDYCELCDLPTSQCIHGRPPAPEPAGARQAATPKARKPAAPRRAAQVARKPVSRRWTPPEALEPLIVAVLDEAGGELEADAMFRELEVQLEDRLLPGDRETTPAGELRWRYAARRARQALINQGMMTKGGPGVWKLARD